MANTIGNPTLGFQAFGRAEGASPTAGMTPVWIASTDASLIFRGDPVITSSSPGTNLSGNYVTSVQITTPSSGFLVRGIFMGCEQFNPTVGRVVWNNSFQGSITGSTGDVKGWIIDDPSQLFLVQASTKGTLTSSFIGLNIGITLNTTTGNTTTGLSNVTVESTICGSTNSLPFRIVDFYSAYAPPAVPAVGTNAFINGTDNTNVANMVLVRMNNCDRLSLTARTS